MDLQLILGKGYFPIELPPPFHSNSFAALIGANRSSLPAKYNWKSLVSLPATHNLARGGALRRKLTVPNPINYYQIGQVVANEWTQLKGLANRSPISLTRPSDKDQPRAVNPIYTLAYRTLASARTRIGSRYVLQADISRFYPSIYTHSIAWAIHTKRVAKVNRRKMILGNVLDLFIRNAQDGQTVGIPIGPDCSLLMAEIILGAVDANLPKNSARKSFRTIDDYEFSFKTYSQAEDTLSWLEGTLNDFELSLNPTKTRILQLPQPIEHPQIAELRSFIFRASARGQQSDIIRYFDKAFEFAASDVESTILKYAISRVSSIFVRPPNWRLYEQLLAQCCFVDPTSIKFVILQLARYSKTYAIHRSIFVQGLNDIIIQHAPLGHGSEVAWALWMCLLLKARLSTKAARAAQQMNDSVVALLLLDANSKGLVGKGVDFSSYEAFLSKEALYQEQWLLSYEADIKGWIPVRQGGSHIDSDPCYNYLKKNGVSFYDDNLDFSSFPVLPARSGGRLIVTDTEYE